MYAKSISSRQSVVSALTLGASITGAFAGDLIYADIFHPRQSNGTIESTSLIGPAGQLIVETGGGLRGIAYDPVEHKIYWTDVDNFMIRRANADGSCVENIITSGLGFPSAIDVDPVGRKIYWGDQADKMQALWRADLDGSNAELIVPTPFHRGVAVDAVNGKVYWTTSISQFKGEILRANLDGTDVETVVTSLDTSFKPADIELDIEGGFIYWTDYVVDIVRRSDLDSIHIQTLFIPPINHNPRGIALDLDLGHVYWGQDTDIITTQSDLMRMELDGANPIVLIEDAGLVNSLVYRSSPPPASCPGDLVDSNTFQPPPDGVVNAADLAFLLGAWSLGPSCADMVTSDTFAPPPDGNVDGADLAFLLGAWGACE
jgi:hypothetical protein